MSKQKLMMIGLSANQNPANGLQKAFAKHFEYRDINTNHPNLNYASLKIAEIFKPDIIFMQLQNDSIISTEIAQALKHTGAFIINYTGDVRQEIPSWYLEMAKHINLTVFTNYTDVYKMREDGFKSDFCELGIDPEIFCLEGSNISTVKPVVFFGNNYGSNKFPLSQERIAMVEYLKYKMPNEFAVYGTGWGNADGNINHSQTLEAEHYRGAKIAINISHFDYDRYSSDRLTRILGTGTFCLCKRFENCETRFGNDCHLVYWDTFEELERLISHYLMDDKNRNRIRLQGMELVHSNYTFENLAKNVQLLYEAYK